MSKTFSIIEQTEKISKVLSKGINGFISISVHVSPAGDWDTYPIIVSVHSYDNHKIKDSISITAFSTQEDELTDEQRWCAPLVEGIEMDEPNGPERVRKTYHKLKEHLEKEGFSVYNHWKEFF